MGLLQNTRRFIKKLLEEPVPCYRCGTVKAVAKFAGFDYCRICADVVPSMYPLVAHDPPFGFPGGKGHTTFVKEVERKEGDDSCPPPPAAPLMGS